MRISDWSSDGCSSDLTVRVNSVSPGPIDTPMLKAEIEWFGGTQEVLDGAINRVPLKRFASPAEVAKAVLFLTADATYATGTTLRLDGGTPAVCNGYPRWTGRPGTTSSWDGARRAAACPLASPDRTNAV